MSNSDIQALMDSIAVVGMTCRFPGANDIETFWRNLCDGVESISFFSDDELERDAIDPAELSDPNYVKARGIVEDIEKFDAHFFGFTRREAEIADPQHKLFLECCMEALEHAGCDPDKYRGSISVFGGAGANTYLLNNLSNAGYLNDTGNAFQALLFNKNDHLTSRVAYKLNLKGPCITVQTACSTSLVAVSMACQALLDYQTDLALAGGATIVVPQNVGYLYREGGISSPDGHCRAFDASAKGVVSSNGVGVVVLKRFKDALDSGDKIWAVIRGSAVNNDGTLKAGYTAPRVDTQAEVIALAQGLADVTPDSVTYIEAHGTATTLGDPIEFEALTRAFRLRTDKKRFCAIGSVKTGIGHLDTAAGVAGLMKTVLMLHHKMIPPSLHFHQHNPEMNMEGSPFYVNDKLLYWQQGLTPRRAGVSSFGIGGTNAHVVLEEAPDLENSGRSRSSQLLLISARTAHALEAATTDLANFLKKNSSINLADVAHTLRVGRKAYEHRRMLVSSDCEDAVAALELLKPDRVITRTHEPINKPVVFMFPGQGAQYVNMGSELYRTEKIFSEQVDLCSDLLKPLLNIDLREVLYPRQDAVEEAQEKLNQTSLTQPALFVTEYALARLLIEWGIRPQIMIGHSIGEYVAACLSGVFSLPDALTLVAARGRIVQSLAAGSMLAVPVSESKARDLLSQGLSLAAVNGPSQCVVSGPPAAIREFQEKLAAEGIECRLLNTSHAFHSEMMDPAIEPFTSEVKKIKLAAPQIPFISNVSGAWIKDAEAIDPSYWADHLRRTVRFEDGLAGLLADPDSVFVEVGPGRTLRTLARWHPAKKAAQSVITSMRHPRDQQSDTAFLLNTIGQLWLAGVEADWDAFNASERRHRLSLPTYQFDRERFWVDFRPRSISTGRGPGHFNMRSDVAGWFYIPAWRQTASLTYTDQPVFEQGTTWLIFTDGGGVAARMIDLLKNGSQAVISVSPGTRFSKNDEQSFEIRPGQVEDYDELLKELLTRGMRPDVVIHFWTLIDTPADDSQGLSEESFMNNRFFSLVFLAQAAGRQNITSKVNIIAVSNAARQVSGHDEIRPDKAMILGPCLVLPREYANFRCRSIDITVPHEGSREQQWLANQIIHEAITKQTDSVIAYRDNRRWVQNFEPVKLQEHDEVPAVLKQGGVYLITGGLGGLGLEVAHFLAREVKARLILVSRSALPPREEWERLAQTNGHEDEVGRKLSRIRQMEQLGSQVLVCRADVSNEQEMRGVLALARERFGEINGVIHSAGVPAGGMIQLKSRESVEPILSPKVKGTQVLESVLEGVRLDFLVLFSSMSTAIGRFGQVDYTAANAFLDAFAHYYYSKTGTMTVSIDWGAWEEVGMAAPILRNLAAKNKNPGMIDHPFLERRIVEDDGREVFITEFSPERHWVLDEHRILGHPVIPGVACFEMVRAALGERAKDRMLEFNDVFFVALLRIEVKEKREVRLELEKEGDWYNFAVRSRVNGNNGSDGTLQNFVIARVRVSDPEALSRYDIAAIRERCSVREIELKDEDRDDDLGPRWHSVKRVHLGVNELLIPLEIPEVFASDFERVKFHPALLDRTTGLAKKYLTAGPYLPFTYKKLKIKADTPRRIYGYAKYKEDESPGKETINFDIKLMDEQGFGLVEIEGFGQKQVNDPTDEIRTMSQLSAVRESGRTDDASNVDIAAEAYGSTAADSSDDQLGSIRPGEGVEALRRILAARISPQVIVSARSLQAMIEQADRAVTREQLEAVKSKQQSKRAAPRRTDSSPYVAPESEAERVITRIWQEVLGVERVGIQDSFFELGGDSLSAVQVLSDLRKEFDVNIPPAMIFEGATVSALAKLLTKDNGEKPDLENSQSRGERRKAKAQERRKAI
jgi:acyl transferase domain-containing protein/acyl carrier protein